MNLNTPKYWEEQFEKEYQAIAKGQSDEGYNRWCASRFDDISSACPETGSILDVGCGLGHLTRYIKAKYPLTKVSGTDMSVSAVQHAREFTRDIEYFVSNENTISSPEKKFDCVIMSELIEHVDDARVMLAEAKRVLKDEGVCIITTPIKDAYLLSDEHIKEYTTLELNDLMNEYFNHIQIVLPLVMVEPSTGKGYHAKWQMAVGRKGKKLIHLKKLYYY